MILKLLFIVGLFVTPAESHPQCLDFDPPFELTETAPVFCQRYAQFGCCSVEENTEIEAKYNNITASFDAQMATDCAGMLKDVLCQWCSPYGAHVFEVEPNFPDLCPDFCGEFYDKCRSTVAQLTDDITILQSLDAKEDFCDTVYENGSIYCYPDIIDNTDLNKEIVRQTNSGAGCFCLEEFATGLRNPMRLVSPKWDASGKIYILEQIGLILIFEKNGDRLPEPFLNISDTIQLQFNRGNENGLIGFTFHNHFVTNRKIYVHYTIAPSIRGLNGISVISEFKTFKDNMNKIDVSTEKVLLKIKQPSSIHNAGELLFDDAGYLYVFLGDGGPANDKFNHGQNRSTLLGSILKLHVDTKKVYKIPQDNPFIGMSDVRPEIYAYGLRNPWRGDFDEGDPITGYGRGRILWGDVGQARVEEVDVLERGANYGWRPREGDICSDYKGILAEECQLLTNYTDPVGAYPHNGWGNAVVAGHVYRGCHSPNLNGLFIFGFHLPGLLYFLNETVPGSNQWDTVKFPACGTDVCYNGWTNEYGRYLMGFGEDNNGEVYLLSSDTARLDSHGGKAFRLIDPYRRGDPDSCRSKKCDVDPYWRYPGKLTVKVDGVKIKCKNCSCEQLEKKNLALLKKACLKNEEAKFACCALCQQFL